MTEPVAVALAGLGRMGRVHARHLFELEAAGCCRVAALVDSDPARAAAAAAHAGSRAAVFSSVAELAASGVCRATVVATPTETHREHAAALVSAGHRVLTEKPLTGTVEGDREFAGWLDREHPHALMVAFQRRFDAALAHARDLACAGAVGRVFKVYSALEDSAPAPDGYQSDGILPDMSIHNVDEILWLTGRRPSAALAVGSRLHSHRLTTCREDFDDALLCLWFDGELAAQVQVSRNHVSGYRVETIVFGEEGQIQVGRFSQRAGEIEVRVYGRRLGTKQPESRVFAGLPDSPGSPEFVARFGAAYKAEVGRFLECCASGEPFPITHREALAAQEAIAAGTEAMLTREHARPVRRGA
ncbi:MAG: Gfo/Idh/MocA family oxidoreductase [Variibacter sp.]|nr:Gfo/Idh/MocA family oxidoreductase [Variibacter sp.]